MSVYNPILGEVLFVVPHSSRDLYSIANATVDYSQRDVAQRSSTKSAASPRAHPSLAAGYRKPDGVTRVPSRTADQYSRLLTYGQA